jgi:hypothetical protein
MANFEDLDKEKLAEAERSLRGKVNTLGKDEPVYNEPFTRSSYSLLANTMTHAPSADGGLIPPNYDDVPIVAAIGTRYEAIKLHSYLPSGLTGPSSVQTFMVVSATPASHNFSDIEEVRIKNLISPIFSQGKANAAHPDTNFRGFELALYPAKSNGGVGNLLIADTDNPVSPIADPTAGPPAGIGTTGNWVVDYENGVVRFSHPPLNGSDGAMNPNNVYSDLEGVEVADGYGAITMFATFYQYTGEYGTTDVNILTVGDGYVSEGTFTGQSHDTWQAAINSLPDEGGTVFIKGGSYDFVKKVLVPSGVKIYGMGGVTIRRPPTEPAFLIQDGYCTIEGVSILNRTDDVVSERGAIEIGTTSETTISDIVIKNNTIESLYYAPANRYLPAIRFASDFNCTIENLTIQGNMFITSSDQHDITHIWGGEAALGTFVNLYKTTISENTYKATGSGQFAEAAFFGNHSTLNNFIFSNNKAESDRDGIVPAGVITVDAITENLTMTGNNIGYIDLVRSISDLVISNNNISSYIEVIGLTGGVISNNKVAQYVPDVASVYINSCTNTVIEGNVLDANLWISNDAELNNVSISNNILREFFMGTGIVTHNTNFSLNKTRALGEGNILESTGSLYVAIGAAGSLATSPDGITWTQQTSSFGSTDIFALAYNGKDLWVAGGDLGKLATSPDGINWTQRTSNFSGSDAIASIDYNGKDLWVAVGTSGTLTTSPDGITWTTQTSGFGSTTIFGVAHNKKDLWVAVGVSGQLATSPNGITWTQQVSSFGATAIYNIAYNGKDLWIATGVSGSGKIATSSNGTAWTQRTSSFGAVNINDVAYNGKDLWVAVSTAGQLATSPNGITWTQQVSSFGAEDISSVIYNGKDLWIAVGGTSSGLIATSPNGVTWTQQTSGFGSNIVFVVDSLRDSNAGALAYGSDNNGAGVLGIGGGNAGIGVEGFGGDGYGAGVKGVGGASGGTGVEGHGSGLDGYGVLGVGSAGLGDGLTGGIGVHGIGLGQGAGVYGLSTSANISSVFGLTGHTDGVGVAGVTLNAANPAAQIASWKGAGTIGVSGEAGRYGIGGEYVNSSTYGEGVEGFNAANGAGIAGYAAGIAGNFTMGVIGAVRGDIVGGAGVVGYKGSASSFNIAQQNSDFDGSGVFGWSDEGAGVKGVSAATTTPGVKGVGYTGTSSRGVEGRASTTQGIGVVGLGAPTFDVDAYVAAWSGASVLGIADIDAGGDSWAGVGGYATSTTSDGWGGFFQADKGVGVVGWTTGGTNLAVGVIGVAANTTTDAIGVIGVRKNANQGAAYNLAKGAGVVGYSDKYAGVVGAGVDSIPGVKGISAGQLLIAVGDQIVTSIDGDTWTQRTDGLDSFNSIAYNGRDLFIAVGNSGAFYTSPDGITWTQQVSSFGTDTIIDINYNGSVWLAICSGSTNVAISYDGISWLHGSTGTTELVSVAYNGKDLWVAVGTNDALVTSRDGLNWTAQENVFNGDNIWDVAHNKKDLWIATGGFTGLGEIATSPDGFHWTQRTSNITTSTNTIAYNGKDLWVAGADNTQLATSPDGVIWTPQVSAFSGGEDCADVIYNGKDLWVAVSYGGVITTSPDGVAWTRAEELGFGINKALSVYGSNAGVIGFGSDDNGTGVIGIGGGNSGIGVEGVGTDGYGIGVRGVGGVSGGTGGVFIGGGPDGYGVIGIGAVDNGIGVYGIGHGTAPGILAVGGTNDGAGIKSYAGDGQLMVAVSGSGKIATSPDGINWTQRTNVFGSNAITAVAYGNGLWVAMGYQDLGIIFPALVATSSDGINWTPGTFVDGASSFQLPSSIYYNDKDLWVAGSDLGGTFAISSDGINWRSITVAANIMSDVVYTKSFWISTHNNVPNGVIISPDGVNWTIYSITGSGSLNGIGYNSSNLLIIVGTGGYLATSPDGVNWEVRTSSFGATDIKAVAHNGKDLWVAVGGSGKLATSPNGITWTQQTSSFGSSFIEDIIYNGKDLWVAIGVSGTIATSPNGTDWTQQTSSFGSTTIESIAIRYGTGSGIIAHGSQYNGTGIISYGHGNLGTGIIGYGGDGYGIGIKGIGGLSGGNGVEGHGGFDGYGVLGVGGASSGSGNSYGSGVLGVGAGDRAGVIGVGGDTGYGVVASADMTSPVRSSLRIVPQNSAPTVGEVGDLYVNINDQKLYICTSAGYPGGPTPTWTVVGGQS